MSQNRKSNQLRIIGGKWRSRKLSFPDVEGLRPTPNRVRETLFNWLAPYIVNAKCLDLFAGSGALGFEALSRGASAVYMIDNTLQVVNQLKKNAVLLSILQSELQICCGDVMSETNLPQGQFDIVFLDPPFYKDLVVPCCQLLNDKNLLAEGALLYIETESDLKELLLPEGWQVIKRKVVGQVGSWLVTHQ
jgi:16S rRNA (guanine966-N2)-methyltransferase